MVSPRGPFLLLLTVGFLLSWCHSLDVAQWNRRSQLHGRSSHPKTHSGGVEEPDWKPDWKQFDIGFEFELNQVYLYDDEASGNAHHTYTAPKKTEIRPLKTDGKLGKLWEPRKFRITAEDVEIGIDSAHYAASTLEFLLPYTGGLPIRKDGKQVQVTASFDALCDFVEALGEDEDGVPPLEVPLGTYGWHTYVVSDPLTVLERNKPRKTVYVEQRAIPTHPRQVFKGKPQATVQVPMEIVGDFYVHAAEYVRQFEKTSNLQPADPNLVKAVLDLSETKGYPKPVIGWTIVFLDYIRMLTMKAKVKKDDLPESGLKRKWALGKRIREMPIFPHVPFFSQKYVPIMPRHNLGLWYQQLPSPKPDPKSLLALAKKLKVVHKTFKHFKLGVKGSKDRVFKPFDSLNNINEADWHFGTSMGRLNTFDRGVQLEIRRLANNKPMTCQEFSLVAQKFYRVCQEFLPEEDV